MYLSRTTLIVAAISLMTSVGLSAEMKARLSVHGRSGIEFTSQPAASTPTIALSKQGQGVGAEQAKTKANREVRYFHAGRSTTSPNLIATQQDSEKNN